MKISKIILFTSFFLISNVFADTIELGAQYVNKDSFKFGDYRGLERKKTSAIAEVDVKKRPPADGTNARYWELHGHHLGLDNREAQVEFGSQGNYKAWYQYDQLPKFETESAKTIFSGTDGGTNLTLPNSWVSGKTTADLTQLSSNLRNVDIERERRKHQLGFSKEFLSNWTVDAEYQHERKEGSKITGAVMGTSGSAMGPTGANARAVLIPEPIDYITDHFTARMRYNTQKTQMQASYILSFFDNQHTSLTWQNPYSDVPGWAASAGYPTGQGRIALPPDNRFHRFMLTAGHALTPKTRLTAQLSRGRIIQDERFLPYTVNPNHTVITPLPRNTLNGCIDTTLLTFKVHSRPTHKFYWFGQYRLDDRNNKTPMDQYLYVGNDTQNQETVDSERARKNLPYSFKHNQLKAEGVYHLPLSTQLRGSYTFDAIRRTFSEVKRTHENTYRVELRRNEVDTFGGGIYALYAKRMGTTYRGNAQYLESYSPSYINAKPENERFANHPLLRKFSIANRQKKQLGFWASYTPKDTVSLQLNTQLNRDDYRRSVLGLKKSQGYQGTLDATYTPSKRVTSHAFYTHEFLNADRNMRSFSGSNYGVDMLAQVNDETRNWWHKQRDRIHTLGTGLEWTEIKDKVDAGLEYTYSISRGRNNMISGSGLTPAATTLPLLRTRLHTLTLYGKYKIMPDVHAKLSYLHERFYSRDWALDNVNQATLASTILTGEKSPRYAVNTVGLSIDYTL